MQEQGQSVRWKTRALRALVATWVALVAVGCAQVRPEAPSAESPSSRREAVRPQEKAGASHTLLLRGDGTVWAWGANGSGQLGDGTTLGSPLRRQVAGLSRVKAVVAGANHSLALRGPEGSVWAWGANGSGQLGDGTTVARLLPVQVMGLEGVVALASGSDHVLALTSGRTVLAWGRNSEGQLGDGSTLPSNTPLLVSGLDDVVAVAARGNHSLALRADGTVWAWGSGVSTVAQLKPTQVPRQTLEQAGLEWAWGHEVQPASTTSQATVSEPPARSSELAQGVGLLEAVLLDSAGLLGLFLLGVVCLGWAWRRPVEAERPAQGRAHAPAVPAASEPAWVSSLTSPKPASVPVSACRTLRRRPSRCAWAPVLEDPRHDVPCHVQPQPELLEERRPEVIPPPGEGTAVSRPGEAPVCSRPASVPDKPVPRPGQDGPRARQELGEHGRARERQRRYREARPVAGAVRQSTPREVSGTRVPAG